MARRPGAQEPARPLGLPGDHGRDAARAHRRDRHVPRRERVLPRLDLRPARGSARSSRSTSSRCATTIPPHPRITYLGGRSSTDPDVVAEVRARAEGKRTLVILDSDHSQAHVEAELAEYAPLVPVGCYVIVEDSNIGQIRKDLLPGPLRGDRGVPRPDGRVRDRPRAREVPDHVEPERLPAPGALGAGDPSQLRRSTTRRRRARGRRRRQSTRSAVVPSATRRPASSMPGCVKT